MLRLSLLSLLFAITGALIAQQWELVTPVKTRSELPAVRMVNSTTGYTIDRALGFVLKTTDAGGRWERKPYNLIDRPRALWMWDEQRGIIAANGGRFYLTDDGFASLTSADYPSFNNIASIFFVNDTLGWAGSETGKIVHTTDGGVTWTQQNSGVTSAVMALHFVDELRGYASATGSILLRTIDGGETWEQLMQPVNGNIFGLHFNDALHGLGVGIGGVVIRTSDGGDTWMADPEITPESLLGIHARGNVVLVMGTDGALLRSTDGGDTFTLQTLDTQDLLGAWLLPDGLGLLVGDARVYRTQDMGASWDAVQIGTAHTRLNKVSFGDDQRGASAGWLTQGGFESGLLRTSDGGRHWSGTAFSGNWLGVHLNADGTGWMGGSNGVNRRTTDYFATTTQNTAPSVAIRSTWAFNATTAIVAGGYINGGCYRTTDGGSSWNYSQTGNIYDLFFVDDQIGFCGGEGGTLHKSTDGGATWQQLTSPSFASIHSIFFLDPLIGFMAGEGSGFRTIDGGATWAAMGGVPQFTMSIFFTDPQTGYAVNVSGQVVHTTDGGDTWTTIVPAPFDALIGDAALVDGALIAVGRYGDVYRAPITCPTVLDVPVIYQSGTMFCTGEETGIQWFLNDEALPDANTSCIEPVSPGNYTVVVTDALGCISAPSEPIQVIGTAVPLHAPATPLLRPNPTSGNVTLTFDRNAERHMILCDTQGRVLREVTSMGDRVQLELHALPAGIYLLRGLEEGWVARVVKQ